MKSTYVRDVYLQIEDGCDVRVCERTRESRDS